MGNKYYSYILVYMDDTLLVIDENPIKYMGMLQDSYTVRENTIKEPDQYMGADINKVYFNNITYAWTMGSNSYIKYAIKNIKVLLHDDSFKFNPKLFSI